MLAQPVVRGARHLHAVGVVDFAVRAGVAVCVVPNPFRQRFAGNTHHRGLVHVVPKAVNTGFLSKSSHAAGPPSAGIGVGEIREAAFTGPHLARYQRTVGRAQEDIALQPFGVHRVVPVYFHPGVQDGDGSDAVRQKFVDRGSGLRETLRIPREYAVLVHVVDVQIQRIAREAVAAERCGKLHHFAVGRIAPFGLVQAQGPQGRKGGTSG